MFKIGEFSKLSRISIRMLRHYDEIGLLVPEETDPWTGYRRYAAAQLMTANRITALRGLGFSLAETAALLACWEDRTAMETRLLAQRAAVEASIQEALDRLRLLDTTIERLRKDEKQMNYDVTIKTLPERQVASVRQILPCYDREGDLWHIFVRETALLHIQDGDPALCISVYHDGEYKEADVDVEIQKTVKGTYPDTEHVKFKTIPPVTVASATQKNLSPRSATRCGSGKQAGGAFQRRLSFLQRVPQIPSQASQAQSAGKNAHAQSGPVPVSPVPGKGPHGAKHEQHRRHVSKYLPGKRLVDHQQQRQDTHGVKARVVSPAVDLLPALVHALLAVSLQNFLLLHRDLSSLRNDRPSVRDAEGLCSAAGRMNCPGQRRWTPKLLISHSK